MKRKNAEPAERNRSNSSMVSQGAKTAKQKRLEKNDKNKTAAASKVKTATKQSASAGKAKAKRDQPKHARQIDKVTPQSKSVAKRKSQSASKASVKAKGMKKM